MYYYIYILYVGFIALRYIILLLLQYYTSVPRVYVVSRRDDI